MNCPRCAALIPDDAVECAQCGIVLAKFHERAPRPPAPLEQSPRDAASGVARIVRAVFLLVLIAITVRFARAGIGTSASETFLHLPNLVFHEAGHVLFSPFGRFMTVLGGSLLQFLVPVILAGAFLRQRNPFGAVVCAWWAGESLVDVAPYIADARALQLVLLGGSTGAEVEGHDWEFILTQLGWLHKDVLLGTLAHRLGLGIMISTIAAGAVYLSRKRVEPEPELQEA